MLKLLRKRCGLLSITLGGYKLKQRWASHPVLSQKATLS